MAAEKLSMSLDAIINRNKREPARRAVRTRAEYAGDGDDRSRSYQTEPAAAAPSGSGRRLFVNNLNYSTTWMSLKDHFKTIGNVLYADVKTEGMGPNARSRGLGIVEFETVEDAQTAIQELNLSQLDGREIFVREDRPPPAREGRDRERRFDRGDGDRDRGGYREREGSFEGGFRSGGGDRGGYRERERSNDGFRSEGGRGGGGGGRGGAAPGCKVVVQGLPYRASWQDLKDLGREIGEVTRADVVTDRNTGRSRGWGFLEFATPQDAEAAVQGIHGRDMEGRVLTAKLDEYNN